MNLRQCEIFRAIMQAGTVTAAAERLHISQPAVSKTLAQMERDLGLRLFLRERRRLLPTPEAQTLYHEVQRAFIGLDSLTRLANELRTLRRGHLVIAASHAIASFYLPPVAAAFLRAHPGISLSIQSQDSPGVAHAVASFRADLGVTQFEVKLPGIRHEPLAPMHAVCVLPPRHPLARRRTIRAQDLHAQNFIALAAVNRLRTRLDALLDAENVTPTIVADTPLASTACALVVQGAGISIIDHLSAEANRHQGILVRPFQPPLAEDLFLLLPGQTPSATPSSALATAFAAELRRAMALPPSLGQGGAGGGFVKPAENKTPRQTQTADARKAPP